MTDERRSYAATLRSLGWSPARIGLELGVTTSTIRRWLDPQSEQRQREQRREARHLRTGECLDCGRPTRYSGHFGYPFGARCQICESLRRRRIDRDEVVYLHRTYGLTTLEIAAYLGCSQPHVSTILTDEGYEIGRGRPVRDDEAKRRYVIRSVTGYPAVGTGGDEGALTSYSVLDTANAYREVATFYVDHVSGERRRARLARRECARLNARDQLEMAGVL